MQKFPREISKIFWKIFSKSRGKIKFLFFIYTKIIMKSMKSKLLLTTAIIFANLTFSATAALAESNLNSDNTATTANIAVTDVSVSQAVDLINNQNALIIDVRTPEEFSEAHLPNAKNFPIDNLSQDIETIKKLQQDRPLLVYCRSGKRSARATEKLKNLGVNSLYNLKGGIKAWSNANYSIIKE